MMCGGGVWMWFFCCCWCYWFVVSICMLLLMFFCGVCFLIMNKCLCVGVGSFMYLCVMCLVCFCILVRIVLVLCSLFCWNGCYWFGLMYVKILFGLLKVILVSGWGCCVMICWLYVVLMIMVSLVWLVCNLRLYCYGERGVGVCFLVVFLLCIFLSCLLMCLMVMLRMSICVWVLFVCLGCLLCICRCIVLMVNWLLWWNGLIEFCGRESCCVYIRKICVRYLLLYWFVSIRVMVDLVLWWLLSCCVCILVLLVKMCSDLLMCWFLIGWLLVWMFMLRIIYCCWVVMVVFGLCCCMIWGVCCFIWDYGRINWWWWWRLVVFIVCVKYVVIIGKSW